MKTALVLGAGGFIGSHMVRRLKSEGYWVRGVDLKYPEFSITEADEFNKLDLRDWVNVNSVLKLETAQDTPFSILPFSVYRQPFSSLIPFDEVYQFAADMGGAGYIFTGEHDADVIRNSAIINIHVADAAKTYGIKKIFYSSSACMYPQELQRGKTMRWGNKAKTVSLKESHAYPANPDSEYGWEKLFSERLYLAYARNYGLDVRIARFHNIYGPEGTYQGGKEKAPAAMCRKVIEPKHWKEMGEGSWPFYAGYEHYIEVWGTGEQTRSFLYIDDCIDAVRLLMQSDFKEPINIGSEEMISINGLAQMAIDISGNNIKIKNIPGPVGVMGRNSDNTLIEKVLGWKPKYSLKDGMVKTYSWIASQMQS